MTKCNKIKHQIKKRELHNNIRKKCPNCASTHIRKNGHRRGKQNYICAVCDRQFIESYSKRGYSDEIKKQCLTMYVNGNSFRAIARQTGVNHNTVILWVKKAAEPLTNAPQHCPKNIVTKIDKLETMSRQKK